MSLVQTLRCDQCNTEIDASMRSACNWHSLSIHDLTVGVQGQFDLCDDCFGHARVPELMATVYALEMR